MHLHFRTAAFAALLGSSLVSSMAFMARESRLPEDELLEGSAVQLSSRDTIKNLAIEIQNGFGSDMVTYITGLAQVGNESNIRVFLQNDGQWYVLDETIQKLPLTVDLSLPLPKDRMTVFTLPDYLSSARVWMSEAKLMFNHSDSGELAEPRVTDPGAPEAALRWGFVEFTHGPGELVANPSSVDFVGLILGINITSDTNPPLVVHGLKAGAVRDVCNEIKALGGWWAQLCVMSTDGKPLRTLSPNLYYSMNHANVPADVFTSYIDEVWTTFAAGSGRNLTIDSQDNNTAHVAYSPDAVNGKKVACSVGADQLLSCAGTPIRLPKPTTYDILSCDGGPFHVVNADDWVHKEIIARLCAAFTRSTLLLNGGDRQPSTAVGRATYYMGRQGQIPPGPEDPIEHYARIVHEHLIDGIGYAFPYDDVSPQGEEVAGLLKSSNPKALQISIGPWD